MNCNRSGVIKNDIEIVKLCNAFCVLYAPLRMYVCMYVCMDGCTCLYVCTYIYVCLCRSLHGTVNFTLFLQVKTYR